MIRFYILDFRGEYMRRKHNYFYFKMLIFSMLIACPFICVHMSPELSAFVDNINPYHTAHIETSSYVVESIAAVDSQANPITNSGDIPESGSDISESSSVANTSASEPSSVSVDADLTDREGAQSVNSYEFQTVDNSYFDDALFIGDSRTVGIHDYSDIRNADYFCDNSMNVFDVTKNSLKVGNIGKTTLYELLQNKKYGKIYVMLGINELGYPFNMVIPKFSNLIQEIRNLQPDAIIYIQANMHVTHKRSSSNDVYTNEKINTLNAAFAELANNKDIFYIDVNPVFDDETGSLKQEYSSDNAHVYGKYYIEWANWLRTQAIVR